MWAEIVGGPRDGEKFSVPGLSTDPPDHIRVIVSPAGQIRPWHPSSAGVIDLAGRPIYELTLDPATPATASDFWRYLWPHNGGPPARSGPPLL